LRDFFLLLHFQVSGSIPRLLPNLRDPKVPLRDFFLYNIIKVSGSIPSRPTRKNLSSEVLTW